MIFIPLLAGLAVIGALQSRRGKKLRRNPAEMFTWKISPAVFQELINNEVENIAFSERTDADSLEMAKAIDSAPKYTITLSRGASQCLADALDNMEDISNDGGYRALARAAGKMRDKISTKLKEQSNPNLGNTGREFKQHAALRIWQDMIEKETGKQLTLDQVKDALRMMERDLRMKAFRVIEGTKRRANPMGLKAVDALVSLCKRKYGGQAAGWAADFAEVCRRGTPQKRLWAQVAQALKRQMYANPRPKRRTR